MNAIPNELKEQIEKAYDFRGHVTIRLKNGQSVEGFLANRIYENGNLPEKNFVELILKGSGDPKVLSMFEINSIELTGEDFAAGNSYEDYLKKKAGKK